MIRKLPIVGVMGSGVDGHAALARPLGEMLARRGVHLLTGGGRGVMREVTEAFVSVPERAGHSIGVLPGTAEGVAPDGYPNRFVELPIRTHLPALGEGGGSDSSRNYVNVLTSDALVFLPGSAGTASEARLAIRFAVPAVGMGGGGEDEGIRQVASLGEVEKFLEAVVGL